jgi:hypothetical protein
MVVVFGVANLACDLGDRHASFDSSTLLKGEAMWRALRNLALKIGNNEDFRELVRGVAMAFGWLIVSAIVVLIVAIIVSALF